MNLDDPNQENYLTIVKKYFLEALKKDFGGTLFRFNLRKKTSDISDVIHTPISILELYQDFIKEEFHDSLLFLKNLKKISFEHIKEDIKKTIFQIEVEKEDFDKHGICNLVMKEIKGEDKIIKNWKMIQMNEKLKVQIAICTHSDFKVKGHLFRTLPFAPSELNFHINGDFDLDTKRKNLQKTENNKQILQEILPKLLDKFLGELPDTNYKLWPILSKVISDLKEFVNEFYKVTKSKIAKDQHSDRVSLNLENCYIVEKDDSKIYSEIYKGMKYHLIEDLPIDLFKYLKEFKVPYGNLFDILNYYTKNDLGSKLNEEQTKLLINNVSTKEQAKMVEIIIKNLNNDEYNSVKEVLIYESLLNSFTEEYIDKIPCSSLLNEEFSTFRKITDIISPNVEEFKNIFKDYCYFPMKKFREKSIIQKLEKKGLIIKLNEFLFEERLFNPLSLNEAETLLKTLDECFHTSWVIDLKKIENFKWITGEIKSEKGYEKLNCVVPDKLYSIKELRPHEDFIYIGSIIPTCRKLSEKLTQSLWKDNIPIKAIIEQIKNIYEKQQSNNFILQPIYKKLDELLKLNPNYNIEIESLFYGGFYPTNSLAFNSNDKWEPFLYKVPKELAELRDLMKALKIPDIQSFERRINILKKLPDEQLSFEEKVIIFVSILNEFEEKEEFDINVELLKKLRYPTKEKDFKLLKNLLYIEDKEQKDNLHILDEKDYSIAHKSLDKYTKKLEIESFTNYLLSECSEELKFIGQQETLVNRIKGICEQYPKNEIIKEMIQNADDSKATKIKIIYDERKYGTNNIISKELAEIQNPSLLFYNDQIFTSQDIDNIQNIAKSKKIDTEDCTGRFGIGFNSLYTLTDCPSIISHDKYIILDPQKQFLTGSRNRTGRLYLFTKELMQIYTDQWEPYKDFEFQPNQPFKGTIIRVPLRRKKSQISEKSISSDDVFKMFEDFKESADNILIWTKHIQKLSIIKIDSNGNQNEYLKIEKKIDNNIKRAQNEILKLEKSILNKEYKSEYSEITGKVEIKVTKGSKSTEHFYYVQFIIGEPNALEYIKNNGSDKERRIPFASCAYRSDKEEEGLFFDTFPFSKLRFSSKTPQFHINATFSIDPSRSNLNIKTYDKDSWNSKIFKHLIPKVLLSCILYLQEKEIDKKSYLLSSQNDNDIIVNFYELVKKEKAKIFLDLNNENYFNIDECFIYDYGFLELKKTLVKDGMKIIELSSLVLKHFKDYKKLEVDSIISFYRDRFKKEYDKHIDVEEFEKHKIPIELLQDKNVTNLWEIIHSKKKVFEDTLYLPIPLFDKKKFSLLRENMFISKYPFVIEFFPELTKDCLNSDWEWLKVPEFSLEKIIPFVEKKLKTKNAFQWAQEFLDSILKIYSIQTIKTKLPNLNIVPVKKNGKNLLVNFKSQIISTTDNELIKLLEKTDAEILCIRNDFRIRELKLFDGIKDLNLNSLNGDEKYYLLNQLIKDDTNNDNLRKLQLFEDISGSFVSIEKEQCYILSEKIPFFNVKSKIILKDKYNYLGDILKLKNFNDKEIYQTILQEIIDRSKIPKNWDEHLEYICSNFNIDNYIEKLKRIPFLNQKLASQLCDPNEDIFKLVFSEEHFPKPPYNDKKWRILLEKLGLKLFNKETFIECCKQFQDIIYERKKEVNKRILELLWQKIQLFIDTDAYESFISSEIHMNDKIDKYFKLEDLIFSDYKDISYTQANIMHPTIEEKCKFFIQSLNMNINCKPSFEDVKQHILNIKNKVEPQKMKEIMIKVYKFLVEHLPKGYDIENEELIYIHNKFYRGKNCFFNIPNDFSMFKKIPEEYLCFKDLFKTYFKVNDSPTQENLSKQLDILYSKKQILSPNDENLALYIIENLKEYKYLITDKNKLVDKNLVMIKDSNYIYSFLDEEKVYILYPKLEKFLKNIPKLSETVKITASIKKDDIILSDYCNNITKVIQSQEFISGIQRILFHYATKDLNGEEIEKLNQIQKMKVIMVKQIVPMFKNSLDIDITKENAPTSLECLILDNNIYLKQNEEFEILENISEELKKMFNEIVTELDSIKILRILNPKCEDISKKLDKCNIKSKSNYKSLKVGDEISETKIERKMNLKLEIRDLIPFKEGDKILLGRVLEFDHEFCKIAIDENQKYKIIKRENIFSFKSEKVNIIEIKEKSEESYICCVCQSNYIDPHSNSCGHLCCSDCWKKLDKCPQCQKPINDLRKTFF